MQHGEAMNCWSQRRHPGAKHGSLGASRRSLMERGLGVVGAREATVILVGGVTKDKLMCRFHAERRKAFRLELCSGDIGEGNWSWRHCIGPLRLAGSVEQVGRGLAWRNSCVGHGSVVATGRRHGCAAMHMDVCIYAER